MKQFLLISPGRFLESWINPSYENKEMDRYFRLVLKDLKEEEKDRKLEYINSLFGKNFCSMECLKNRLKKGGLEKTASAIEMHEPNSRVGRITYQAKNGNGGDFGIYILEK